MFLKYGNCILLLESIKDSSSGVNVGKCLTITLSWSFTWSFRPEDDPLYYVKESGKHS